MEKLISMTDFVLLISKQTTNEGNSLVRSFNKIKNYANFLKQPLKLEMFVPCVNGEPFNYTLHGNKEQYDKAKEKVLFILPITIDISTIKHHIYQNRTVEYFTQFDNVYLTESAIKQIGL